MAQIPGYSVRRMAVRQRRSRHQVWIYWRTAGIVTVLCAVIPLVWSSLIQSAPSYDGHWEGMISNSYRSARIELDLQSAGTHQVTGHFFNNASGCPADVSGTVTGTTLTLDIDRMGSCGGRTSAEVQLLGTGSLRFTREGDVPMSGYLSRAG